MAILANQLLLFGSEVMSDADTGGGPVSALNIQNGTTNLLFDGVMPADAAGGRLQLRKAYVTVNSANADALNAAQVAVHAMPNDANLDVVIFAPTDIQTQVETLAPGTGSGRYITTTEIVSGRNMLRGAVAEVLGRYPLKATVNVSGEYLGDSTGTGIRASTRGAFEVGDVVVFTRGSVNQATHQATITGVTFFGNGPPPAYTLTLSGTWPAATDSYIDMLVLRPKWSASEATSPASVFRCCGLSTLTSAVSAGATTLPLNRVMAKIVPYSGSTYPDSANGINPDELRGTNGRVPIFHDGQQVLIRHPTTGVTEERTIERVFIGGNGSLRLTSGLTNAYPSGAFVSSIANVGTLQAQVGSRFVQQTWTRVWSDTPIGNSISAAYSGTISVQNIGCVDQRWAIVFTSSIEFELYGETLGKVANGSIGTTFSPNNPRTNTPFLSMPSSGWGSGWLRGNALRFNTSAAHGHLWVGRCISPGASTGAGSVTLQIRGGVNA